MDLCQCCSQNDQHQLSSVVQGKSAEMSEKEFLRREVDYKVWYHLD